MGGKSKGAKVDVVEYRMSMHMGICAGADAITGLYCGEKPMWEGHETAETAIPIYNTELFGGIKKEGGVAGTAYYLPGGDTQVLPDGLAARFGLTGATCPGFRGVTSVFFVGQLVQFDPGSIDYATEWGDWQSSYNVYGWGGEWGSGFYWGANNPYLRSIWARVRRTPKGLTVGQRIVTTDPFTVNPAHIIYECLRNTEWGMGAPSSIIDEDSFEAAGETLYNEGFGLSMIWTRQSTIESFVTEVLDHIQATLFVNPKTGLFTLKLIRGDYDPDELPVLTPDNCRITSFQRKGWGETINEVIVTWTNPANEQEETVSVQDLANITIQGPVSDSRNYYGVRTAALATQLATRDLWQAAAPLATFDIRVNRAAWDFLPGGVVKLNYPEYGLDGVIVRIGKIDYGKPGDGEIKINAVEDIFGQPFSNYAAAPGTQWEHPSADPEPMENVRVISTPLYFADAALSAADLGALDYPEVLASVLAAQENSDDTIGYELISSVTSSSGDTLTTSLGQRAVTGYAELLSGLDAEASSLISGFPNLSGQVAPTTSTFMFIGDVDDDEMEIALITAVDGAGFQVKRGVLDTTPKPWPIGTSIWFVNETSNVIDTTAYAAGEIVIYKLLTRTSRGLLDMADAPLEGTTLSERPYLPLRPADVQVEGVDFGTVDATALTDIDITWANRNRLTEPVDVLGWSDATVTPEAGQTTTVTLIDADTDTVIDTIDGLTGTSTTVAVADFGSIYTGIVRVTSKRDGFESLQGHEITILVNAKDYLLLSGDEASNRLALSGDAATGNLILGSN